MKIATYNVNGINGRLPVVLRWLDQAQPDVVCLQELKSPNEKFPEEALRGAGYDAVWHGQKSWNGVAILAKKTHEILEVVRGLDADVADEQSRYIQATIGGIKIASLYLPNGNPAPGPKFDYKMNWFNRLVSKAGELINEKTPVILAGDYNVIPTDIDAYKPERWVKDAVFFPEPRAAFQQLLQQGWVDAIRKLYPDQKIFTYWDYFRNAFNRDAGIRMDHILLSPQLGSLLKGGGVDRDVRGWEKTSDHAPVWVELQN